MGVSDGEFRRLWSLNATAEIISRNAFKEISGIKLKVEGVKGGNRPHLSRQVLWYTVFLDVDNIRGSSIPPVFILIPRNEEITHVNIFGPARCAKLNMDLPHVCWGDYNQEWSRTERHNRTLLSLVKRLEFVLKNQNFSSPARTPSD